MSITRTIEFQIDKIPDGEIFTLNDFDIDTPRKNTIVKILNNLVIKGIIKKYSKGKFYKPIVTEFGALQPDLSEITKEFIENDRKIIGYLTGYSIYNDLLLTTQIANSIQIGTNKYRRSVKRGKYNISFVLQSNKISRFNYHLLQILDAVRFVQSIPATTTDEACKRLIQIFYDLSHKEQLKIATLALKYSDYVIALCGAILEHNRADRELLVMLKKPLNEITIYKIGISEKILPTKTKWRIQ